jgi:hypothetical protein
MLQTNITAEFLHRTLMKLLQRLWPHPVVGTPKPQHVSLQGGQPHVATVYRLSVKAASGVAGMI